MASFKWVSTIITKQTQKQLKRTNNEANYSHFTILGQLALAKSNQICRKNLLITSSWDMKNTIH
jgi:hypothetical protein